MSIKVINNIECTDTNHNVPRIISIESSPDFNHASEYIEVHCDNNVYKVKAQDLRDAINNATRTGSNL